MMPTVRGSLVVAAAGLLVACSKAPAGGAPTPASGTGARIVEAARAQVGVCVRYQGAYVAIGYPGGDVPPDRGVCTDVVVRALRAGLGYDLQKEVHEDMTAHFAAYPNLPQWNLSKPDTHIDHRRVPNLEAFFRRQGWELPAGAALAPGDLVTCRVGRNAPHIMVVADPPGREGDLRVLHNIGGGTREEVVGFALTGRFRVEGR